MMILSKLTYKHFNIHILILFLHFILLSTILICVLTKTSIKSKDHSLNTSISLSRTGDEVPKYIRRCHREINERCDTCKEATETRVKINSERKVITLFKPRFLLGYIRHQLRNNELGCKTNLKINKLTEILTWWLANMTAKPMVMMRL